MNPDIATEAKAKSEQLMATLPAMIEACKGVPYKGTAKTKDDLIAALANVYTPSDVILKFCNDFFEITIPKVESVEQGADLLYLSDFMNGSRLAPQVHTVSSGSHEDSYKKFRTLQSQLRQKLDSLGGKNIQQGTVPLYGGLSDL